jgi:hypothetical protein
MAAGNTYESIATQTLGSATATVTFSSISSAYTDLVLVCNAATSVAGYSLLLRFNSDSGSNYSQTQMYGNGTTAGSNRGSNLAQIYLGYTPDSYGTVGNNNFIVNIQNYSNSTTYKTALCRNNNMSSGGTNATEAAVGLWRNTAAISTVSLTAGSGNILTGSTFTLYGILAA